MSHGKRSSRRTASDNVDEKESLIQENADYEPVVSRKKKIKKGKSPVLRKVAPHNESQVNSFDGVQDIVVGDGLEKRKIKPGNRNKKTTRLTGSHLWNFRTYLAVFTDKRACITGIPFFTLAVLVACIAEVCNTAGHYNVVITLALLISVEFSFYPVNSVRIQLSLIAITAASCVLDVYLVYSSKSKANEVMLWMLVVLKLICVGFCVRNFKNASRVRKYMDRRIRLFFIPLRQPKRIMRDVRARLLALGWLHLLAILMFAGQFLVLVLKFDYSARFLSPSRSQYALPMFLAGKAVSSALVFGGIYYDTDIVLCLWYFGFLALWPDYVKKYLHKKKAELGGWPLAFSFHLPRFYILAFVKFLDVLWGIYGWVLMGYTFGSKFQTVETEVRYLYVWIVLAMIGSDIYCSTLFLGVRWLLRRFKIIKQLKMLEVSDDSELDEFQLRKSDNDHDSSIEHENMSGDIENRDFESTPLVSKQSEVRGQGMEQPTFSSNLLRSRSKPSTATTAAVSSSAAAVGVNPHRHKSGMLHREKETLDGIDDDYPNIGSSLGSEDQQEVDVMGHSSDEELDRVVRTPMSQRYDANKSRSRMNMSSTNSSNSSSSYGKKNIWSAGVSSVKSALWYTSRSRGERTDILDASLSSQSAAAYGARPSAGSRDRDRYRDEADVADNCSDDASQLANRGGGRGRGGGGMISRDSHYHHIHSPMQEIHVQRSGDGTDDDDEANPWQ